MDAATVQAYERHALEWVAARHPGAIEDGRLAAFARRVRRGGLVVDLGCGPGWYAAYLRTLGFRVVAADIAMAMLTTAQAHAPPLPRVCADLSAPPFAGRSLDAAWAINCYPHLPRHDLPVALARLHAALRPGAPIELTLVQLVRRTPTAEELAFGEGERRFPDDRLPGRLFSTHAPERARALLIGAGFDQIRVEPWRDGFWLRVRARRARSLPDTIRPGLRLLICGLNPSVYSADRGVPFARPGNRFWPAARAAELISRERDPFGALLDGIGMTDLVKRPTSGATELRRHEYAAGLRRVEALVRLYCPGATCFVGLDGWRKAVDRTAKPGWIPGGFGSRPAYLMPSTSGRNARTPPAELAAHLRTAAQQQRRR